MDEPVDSVQVELHTGSADARWANERARELLSARVLASREVPSGGGPMPKVFTEAVTRVINETLRDGSAGVQRLAYLVAAQAHVGEVAVITAGLAMWDLSDELPNLVEDPDRGEDRRQRIQDALEVVASTLEQKGESGVWL